MVRGQNEGAGIAMCVLPPLAFHRPASRLFIVPPLAFHRPASRFSSSRLSPFPRSFHAFACVTDVRSFRRGVFIRAHIKDTNGTNLEWQSRWQCVTICVAVKLIS